MQPAAVCAGTEAQGQHFPVAENVCTVLRNSPVNAEYRHLELEATEVALTARPGQFFHLLCPKVGTYGPYLRRPMSIYRVAPAARRIEFLYKVQGVGTHALATLAPGDRLDALGPLGHGFSLDSLGGHVLMVARGVGLATMAPLAEASIARGAAVTAILSARSAELAMSVDYLSSVGAKVEVVTDADGSSEVGRLEQRLRDLHGERAFSYIATCGSNRLLQLTKRLAAEFGIPGEVALEQLMGCAIGMCFACVKPFDKNGKRTYQRVCWEGPVFDVRETPSW